MKHDLKILPAFFEAVICGDKTFEIRKNGDRGFQKGDTVILHEWSPDDGLRGRYTARRHTIEITYVTNYEQKDDYVVFGFKEVK